MAKRKSSSRGSLHEEAAYLVRPRDVVVRDGEGRAPGVRGGLAEFRVLEMGYLERANVSLREFGLMSNFMRDEPWEERLPVTREDIEFIQWKGGTVEPNTEIWYKCRRGRITASSRAFILQGNDMQAWKALADELHKEMESDFKRVELPSHATAWGHRYEPMALREIGLALTGKNSVSEPGFVLHDEYDMCGATPDGYLWNDTTIQVKCLNKKEHELTISTNTIQNKYYAQVQFESWISCRPVIIYASFHPLVGNTGDKGRLHIIEVPLDEAMHDRFACNLGKFQVYFDGLAPWPVVSRQVTADGGIHVGGLFP